jgi:hypothetical protein
VGFEVGSALGPEEGLEVGLAVCTGQWTAVAGRVVGRLDRGRRLVEEKADLTGLATMLRRRVANASGWIMMSSMGSLLASLGRRCYCAEQ